MREVKSGKKFTDMGRIWARENLDTDLDNRRLEDVGIESGMQFQAVPLAPQT